LISVIADIQRAHLCSSAAAVLSKRSKMPSMTFFAAFDKGWSTDKWMVMNRFHRELLPGRLSPAAKTTAA
jgi:hypothetical protein